MKRIDTSEIINILRIRGFIGGRSTGDIVQLFYRVFGDGIKVLPPEEKTCYTCGGSYWWISKDDARLYCAVCHPPASKELVAGYLGDRNQRIEIMGQNSEVRKEEGPEIEFQKDICKWCMAGRYLDCPDCREDSGSKTSK